MTTFPAEAGSCYGPRERALAKKIVANAPIFVKNLKKEREVAKQVRNETCDTIAVMGRVVDVDYSYFFFTEEKNHLILVSSGLKRLDPLRVHAAIVDLLFPPQKEKKRAKRKSRQRR